MMRGVFILILFSLCMFSYSQAITQKSKADSVCFSMIRQAEANYNNSLYIDCLDIIEQALSKYEMKRADKTRSLELAAKASVEIGEIGKADSYINVLIKTFPHYDLKEEENSESFNRLVKKYKIHPLITIGVKNVANWLQHKTTGVYTVLDGLDYSQPQAKAPYWFTYYGMAEYEFIDGISANIDLMFFLSSYNRVIEKDPTFRLTYTEHDGFIEFPVYLKKYFHFGKNFLVYASGGAGLIYMWKARGTVTLTYTTQDIITGRDADFSGYMEDVNYLDMKNRATGQWNAGIGVGYKIKNLRLFLDARYLGGIGSFTDPEKSDLFPELKNDFFYIDQKMKINQFEMGATISYTLFNSVKRIRK